GRLDHGGDERGASSGHEDPPIVRLCCNRTVAHRRRRTTLCATWRLRLMRREIVLPATREQVWAALTDSEQLSAWFEAEVDIDPRPRGDVTARDPDGTIRRGTVIAASAPYRLVVAWEGARD